MFKPTKKQHVVNKAYADKNGGSGGGTEPLIVQINGQEEEGRVYADRTYREVSDALAAGRTVLCSSEYSSSDEVVILHNCIIGAEFFSVNNPPGYMAYYSSSESKFHYLYADSMDGYIYMLSD